VLKGPNHKTASLKRQSHPEKTADAKQIGYLPAPDRYIAAMFAQSKVRPVTKEVRDDHGVVCIPGKDGSATCPLPKPLPDGP